MNYFSLEEFLRSDTALKNKIENLPSFEVIENIKKMLPVLNDMRVNWGSGIRITSGYRSAALNRKVGGVNTSSHQYGLAVDLQPVNGDIQGFKRFIVEWAKGKKYDKIILEKSAKTEWVHFAFMSRIGEQRCKCFSMEV